MAKASIQIIRHPTRLARYGENIVSMAQRARYIRQRYPDASDECDGSHGEEVSIGDLVPEAGSAGRETGGSSGGGWGGRKGLT